MLLCCSRSAIHHASSDDGSSLVAADARAKRIGAKPSRAVVARGLRHIVLTYDDSAVFGAQQEAKTNSLVTMTGAALLLDTLPGSTIPLSVCPERLPARSGRSVPVFSWGLTSVELLNNGVRLTTLGKVPVPSDHKSRHKSPCVVDQHPPHDISCQADKVCAVIPIGRLQEGRRAYTFLSRSYRARCREHNDLP